MGDFKCVLAVEAANRMLSLSEMIALSEFWSKIAHKLEVSNIPNISKALQDISKIPTGAQCPSLH